MTPERPAGEPGGAPWRLTAAIVGILVVIGAAAWFMMPRQEDPAFPARYGGLTALFPGADAETVDRLVVGPLEEELLQVDAIRHVDSTARGGAALIFIELRDDIYDTNEAWDRVRAAVERAKQDLPEGALDPVLRDDVVEQESVVLAVTGSADPLALREGARTLRRALLRVERVARVTTISDPGEQVTVALDDAEIGRLGLTYDEIARQIAARNRPIPAGNLRLGTLTAPISAGNDFATVADVESTHVALPAGGSVALGDVARVRRGPSEPRASLMRHDGQLSVGLGVVPRDATQLVAFGDEIRRVVEEQQRLMSPLEIRVVSFQPDYVAHRLGSLGSSLFLSILIVFAVLFFSMGRWPALIVASVVPIVGAATLAIYWLGGGVLHQVSVAAFVIALGMLVDNAIVVVEAVQARLEEGMTPRDAARSSVRALRLPLSVATATTVGAFVPMLVATGETADFTRSLPIVIIAALTLSLLAALWVVPLAASRWLTAAPVRPRPRLIARALGTLGSVHYRAVLVVTGVALVAVAVGSLAVEQRFFPAADRDQMTIDLSLRESSHLDETDAVAERVEAMLRARPDVRQVTSFVGRGLPRFYYNVASGKHAPHRAQLLVVTAAGADRDRLTEGVRRFIADELPGVGATVAMLEQGPAVVAPVELRIYGDRFEDRREVSDLLLSSLNEQPEARDARTDLDLGAPTIRVAVADGVAGRHGVARSDVARALLAQTRGLGVGELRHGAETVPILLRSEDGEETSVRDLDVLRVAGATGAGAPLGRLAVRDVQLRPAALYRRDGQSVTRITAQVSPGATAAEVLRGVDGALAEARARSGIDVEVGGTPEASARANVSLLKVAPFGLLIIFVCLLWEFRSFRRTAIVLATVPLALLGVVPGLLISGQPLGFMALLGMIALAGIVVNNAIVLLDVVERERGRGQTIEAALARAVEERTRPIFLTTVTTVAGLVPLAFSSSTLWPPLAWATISGLSASTMLTLVVIPALYRALFRTQSLVATQRPGECAEEDRVEETAVWGRLSFLRKSYNNSPLPPLTTETRM